VGKQDNPTQKLLFAFFHCSKGHKSFCAGRDAVDARKGWKQGSMFNSKSHFFPKDPKLW